MVPGETGPLTAGHPDVGELVALLTDFGQSDGYVGALRGAVLAACPGAHLVDLTHDVPPGDVATGARLLAQAVEPFPRGTVICAVVDPGVGTRRRGIAVEIDGHRFVAPDNGLLDEVLERGRVSATHALEAPELWRQPVSPVFHGRDVFGPVAGFLAAGGRLAAVGPAVDPAGLVRLEVPRAERAGDRWCGHVVAVDHFGNLITNLPDPGTRVARVEVAGRTLPLRHTYADVAPGELLALVGSTGRIEIACNRGRAVDALGEGAAVGLLVASSAPSGEPS